jgi:subtilisin family serine protease
MNTKSWLMIACFFFTAFNVFSQDKYYYGNKGEKVALKVVTDKVLIKFSNKVDANKRASLMNSHRALGNVVEKRSNDIMATFQLETSTARTEKDIDALIKSLNNERDVEYASPMFSIGEKEEISITNKFIVKIKSEADFNELQSFAAQKGLTIERQMSFNKNIYVVKADKASAGSSLEMANLAFELGKFAYSQPDFVRYHLMSEANDEFVTSEAGKKEIAKVMENAKNLASLSPQETISDPYFYLQYHHQNNGGPITGTSRMNGATVDADLDVVEAWGTTKGEGVVVAVLDEGVDRAHPDLDVLNGYDAAYFAGVASSNRNGNPDQIVDDAAHGTNCAGLVAAKDNSIGVRGVAPDAKILAVRIFAPSTSDEAILLAMEWAIDNGADVISNSWGGGGFSAAEEEVFTYAYTNGRGGKGTVVLCSAGNNGVTTESFPAAFPLNISIGGSTMCDTRHRSTANGGDCSDEGWWGTNYGNSVDVYTPCVALFSTDNSGIYGYSNGTGTLYPTPAPITSFGTPYADYSWFNGTSASCPIAAGTAALVLSANPNLSALEARYALESSTDKVGGYSYTSNPSAHPHGTWSFDLGYGRLNADKAVDKAIDLAENPALLIDFVASNYCGDRPYTFSPVNRSTGASYYFWAVYNDDFEEISEEENPTFTISEEGTYYVYLHIEDEDGNEKELEKEIRVGFPEERIASMPFFANLENEEGALPEKWAKTDMDGDGYTFEVAEVSAFGEGDYSLFLNHWDGYTYDLETFANGFVDGVEAPGIDISNVNLAGADDYSKAMPVVLSFDYAYAAYPLGSTIFSETMFITVRGDCMGVEESFILYEEDLANLATRTPTTAFFTPTASQWGTFTIDLTQIVEQMKAFGYAEKTVFFGVSNLGNFGNNFYIDNIRYDDLSANFMFSENHLCGTGNTVRFDDISTGNPTSREWYFEGGSPMTSTNKGLSVRYNNIGKFDVGIEVTDADGFTSSIYVEDLISVIDNTTKYPYTSTSILDYETSAQRNATPSTTINGWKVFDELGESGDLLFTTARSAFGVGTASAAFDNYLNEAGTGTTDGYVSLPIDITKDKDLSLVFDYAYRIYPGSADGLIIAYAIDCGDDTDLFGFTTLWEKYGSDLATVSGSTTSSFNPTSTQWKTERIDLSAVIRANPNGKSIRIALINYNDYGNRIWVDNIQLGKCAPIAPTVSASNLSFSDIGMGRVDLSWTRGNGNNQMVIAKKGKFAVDFAIPAGTTASAGTWHFGKNEIMPGHFLIYHGTGTTLNDVKGLMAGEEYSFAVVEYSTSKVCGDAGNRFAKATTKSVTTTSSIASEAWMGSNTLTSAYIYWNNGSGDGRMAVMRENSRISGIMDRMIKQGHNYSTHANLGWGEDMGDGHYAMYAGTNNWLTSYNLTPNKNYGFAVIEYYLDADGKRVYHTKNMNSVRFEPMARMATNVRMTSAGTNSMSIAWNNGNGQNRMVVMKEGRGMPRSLSSLSNGWYYSANSNFGSGHHLGEGIYVVYNSNGSSTTVSGLKPNTLYSFAVVEYDNYTSTYYLNDYQRVEGKTERASSSREGVEETQESTLSLEENFEVYPNPSKGEVNFVMFAGNQKPVHLAIYNSVGALVYEVTANDELNTKLDVSKFGKGMFVAKVTVDGNSSTKKFVIE